ncbi:MAG: hypothetical protein QXX41_10370 [Nitrososphaerota archaeon]
MPRVKSSRTEVQKYLRRTWGHLEDGLKDLVEAYNIVHSERPELSNLLREIGVTIYVCQEAIKEFWRQVWGEPPENLRTHH